MITLFTHSRAPLSMHLSHLAKQQLGFGKATTSQGRSLGSATSFLCTKISAQCIIQLTAKNHGFLMICVSFFLGGLWRYEDKIHRYFAGELHIDVTWCYDISNWPWRFSIFFFPPGLSPKRRSSGQRSARWVPFPAPKSSPGGFPELVATETKKKVVRKKELGFDDFEGVPETACSTLWNLALI